MTVKSTRTGFEAAVRDAVWSHAPVDALEPYAAWRAVIDTLMNTIICDHNAAAAGGPIVDRNGRQRRAWDRTGAMRRIADRAIERQWSDVGSIATVIVRDCFAMARNRDFIDTDEIPLLIGISFGVALEIERRDAELAERIVLDA
jgi:hypothetical protein